MKSYHNLCSPPAPRGVKRYCMSLDWLLLMDGIGNTAWKQMKSKKFSASWSVFQIFTFMLNCILVSLESAIDYGKKQALTNRPLLNLYTYISSVEEGGDVAQKKNPTVRYLMKLGPLPNCTINWGTEHFMREMGFKLRGKVRYRYCSVI